MVHRRPQGKVIYKAPGGTLWEKNRASLWLWNKRKKNLTEGATTQSDPAASSHPEYNSIRCLKPWGRALPRPHLRTTKQFSRSLVIHYSMGEIKAAVLRIYI